MEWLFRLSLDLPPRQEDIKAIKNLFPELFNNNKEINYKGNIPIISYPFLIEGKKDFFVMLKEWIKNYKNENINNDNKNNNKFINCPFLQNNSSDDFIQFLTIGGFKAEKPPKDRFFDLVRKTHKEQKVKDIFLTDKYLFLETDEKGKDVDYSLFYEYLNALNINKNDEITIYTNPFSKSQQNRIKFINFINLEYKNIKFDIYSNNFEFHDRLYIVRCKKGIIKGIFGPSLNGLNTNSIVIMGDLIDDKIIKKLENIDYK